MVSFTPIARLLLAALATATTASPVADFALSWAPGDPAYRGRQGRAAGGGVDRARDGGGVRRLKDRAAPAGSPAVLAAVAVADSAAPLAPA
jgi:hypothetical protein